MANMAGWLRVRVPLDLLVAVDRAAGGLGMTRSLWVRRALLLGLGSDHIGGEPEGVPVASAVKAAEAIVAAREPALAAVQQTRINGSDRARQEAAERAHWEKVARMQKIKGN